MPENAFLQVIADFLRGPAGLTPAPALVGPALPALPAEAPAIVLALADVERIHSASRTTEPSTEALARDETIDLAAAAPPAPAESAPISADRREWLLASGGLVRADGTEGMLGAADMTVRVAGEPFTLVRSPARDGEVSVEAGNGRLRFAVPLPDAGLLRVSYFVAATQRQVTWLRGTLLLSVHDRDARIVENLSVAATRALLRTPPNGVRELTLESLSAIGAPDPLAAQTRARSARLRFQFEHVETTAATSGDRIRSIPVATPIGLRGG